MPRAPPSAYCFALRQDGPFCIGRVSRAGKCLEPELVARGGFPRDHGAPCTSGELLRPLDLFSLSPLVEARRPGPSPPHPRRLLSRPLRQPKRLLLRLPPPPRSTIASIPRERRS